MVDIRFVRKFSAPLPLDLLRKQPGLKGMELLRKGSRLSVQPVRPSEWAVILKLAGG
jgi:predicted RNA-binding protein with PUA-like domain